MKKKQRKLLAAILAAAMLIPQSVMTAGAAENPEPVYENAGPVTVTGGSGAVTADQDVINTMKSSEDATVNLTFTMTGSDVQSLFFMGDSSAANNYIMVYLSGHTLGVESRYGAGGTQQISDRTYTISSDVDLSEPHTLTFVMDGNSSYSFYLDGEQVKTSAVTCAYNSNLTDSDYIGFGNGARNGNTYPFTGTLSKIEMYNAALSEDQIMSYHNGGLEDVVYSHGSVYYPAGTALDEYKTETNVSDIASLTEGSISVRYRVADAGAGVSMLAVLSDGDAANPYLGLYVNPSANTVGLDAVGLSNTMLNSKSLNLDGYAAKGVAVNDANWHTLTVTKADNDLRFYLDGVFIDHWSNGMSEGFFNLVDNADTLGIGKAVRSEGNANAMNGAIDSVKIYSSVLTDEEIARDHALTQWTAEEEIDMTDAFRSETEDLYYSGYEGSSAYRIPSLLTTEDGTQLAFIDKRNSGAGDAGNIDAVVRRKEKGSDTFSDPITLVDLPNNGGSAAFAIDMVTVQDQDTGKIFAFVDMFPESSGLMNTELLQTGVGYKEVDGTACQILYTNPEESEEYGYIADIEDGIGHVLNNDGEDTGYSVVVYPKAAEVSLQEKGNLYKDGVYKGNIYMKSGPDAGELRVLNTSYLWMVTSDDDGKTWSDPVDITPQVKEDWCLFFGTGPGVGIQLHTGDYDGRLVVPIYTANSNVGGSQSSAVIYSDDHGDTWKLGDSPQTLRNCDRETMTSGDILTESQAVQLNNGNVLLFMRNNFSGKVQMATSLDGGATWKSIAATELTDVYCQLTVIHYTKPNGEEYVLLCNPSGPGRTNGRMHLGQVQADGTISWNWQREVDDANEGFAYSCLTLTDGTTDNPEFALMYEDQTSSIILKYFEFDENYLKAGNVTPAEMDAPQLVSKDVEVTDNTVNVSLTFDQTIMAAGTPQITLAIGSATETAAYVSGSGTDTITFEGTMPAGMGVMKLTAISTDNGYLENIQNKVPVLNGEVELYTNTELDLAGTEVTYTSQHSNSTAEGADGAAVNVIDGNPNTYWHSRYGDASITLPQSVTLELTEQKTIYKVDYLARQNGTSGRVSEYGIEVSTDGAEYTEVAHGTLAATADWQEIEFVPAEAKYVRFIAYSSTANGSCAVAELKLHEYSEGVIEAGDTTALAALDAETDGLIETNYSAVTWEVFRTAKTAAETVLGAEVVSQVMIDRAAENLKNAYAGLVDISRAVASFKAIRADEDKYTPASWALLEAWMTEHEPELANANTSKDVTDIVVALAFQAGQLVEKADKTALEELLTEYTVTKPLTEDGYQADSWTRYQNAISDARAVAADPEASVQDVTDAITELTDARTDLKADMSELKTVYDQYAKLSEDDYLENTDWEAMQTALRKADEMLKEGTAAPADVKEMIAELNAAYNALDLRPDTDGLQKLYDKLKAELPDLGLYMSEGAAKMQEAFEAAEAVLEDPQTEDEVQAQMEALREAYSGLVLKATEKQILELTGLEESLGHKDLSGLSEEQRQQVQEVREALWEAITADEISAEYADELLEKAEAAMALTGEAEQPDDKPSGDKPDASGDKTDGAGNKPSDTADKAVKTGDATEFGWIFLMLAAGIATAVIVIRRRQNMA
ncbi:MAG TPA: exo-alpha-sialidase [Candidatus Mediterraneibacter stercorigallinarum]|uniref:exo-alpha-sialidase n=1 Tax=Candidatus Mediterraneibacter stercorigallinarum TaxID=2838686 RepID=A0A9D2D9M7_9FIRM|nr:exo-alpha-sialidase [Candidatus Mediterraneibacter stercorigallinarum]